MRLLVILIQLFCVCALRLHHAKLKTKSWTFIKLRDTVARDYVADNYAGFDRILRINVELSNEIKESAQPITVFVPNKLALSKLPKDALQKILDPRNAEVAEKIASYHYIPTR